MGYVYAELLCSPRGQVRPRMPKCRRGLRVRPDATAMAVGYVHIGVMFARDRCARVLFYKKLKTSAVSTTD